MSPSKHVDNIAKVFVLSLVLLWPLSSVLLLSQAAAVARSPGQWAAPTRPQPAQHEPLNALKRSLKEDSKFQADTTSYAEALASKEGAQVHIVYADRGAVPTPKSTFRRDLTLDRYQHAYKTVCYKRDGTTTRQRME